jgi:hypothetical protein
VETAAANTGIDPSVLSGIAEHLGGEGALGQIAQHLSDNPQMLQSVLGAFGGQGGEGAQGGLGGLLGGFGVLWRRGFEGVTLSSDGAVAPK